MVFPLSLNLLSNVLLNTFCLFPSIPPAAFHLKYPLTSFCLFPAAPLPPLLAVFELRFASEKGKGEAFVESISSLRLQCCTVGTLLIASS